MLDELKKQLSTEKLSITTFASILQSNIRMFGSPKITGSEDYDGSYIVFEWRSAPYQITIWIETDSSGRNKFYYSSGLLQYN